MNSTERCRSTLVIGVYLANQANTVEHIVRVFGSAPKWQVTQKWASLGEGTVSGEVSASTVIRLQESEPKFVILNRVLAEENLPSYEYVLVCDDDITVQQGFLETYLDLVDKYDFALAQPARTHASYIDHHFVERLDGLTARRTRYVEIGPLFSVRRDLFDLFFPFDESSPMGWGYDFAWPCLIESLGLRMGVIDSTPVDHSLRKPVKNYSYDEANSAMRAYLARMPHLSKDLAFSIVESYAE